MSLVPNLMTKTTRISLLFMVLLLAMDMVHALETNGGSKNSVAAYATTEIQRVRIYFTSPTGLVRYLLLGFTSDDSATDGFDFGYDAINRDNLPDDLNWMIEDGRYLIQGVGAFNENKEYPLGMFLQNNGDISIGLLRTENFENPIDVYVHDKLLNTYTLITEQSAYSKEMTSGDYLDRFYITFKDNSEDSAAKNSLSTADEYMEHAQINYLRNTKELYVKTSNGSLINNITLYNISGKKIYSKNNLHDSFIKTKLSSLNSNHAIVTVESDDGKISSKQLIIN